MKNSCANCGENGVVLNDVIKNENGGRFCYEIASVSNPGAAIAASRAPKKLIYLTGHTPNYTWQLQCDDQLHNLQNLYDLKLMQYLC